MAGSIRKLALSIWLLQTILICRLTIFGRCRSVSIWRGNYLTLAEHVGYCRVTHWVACQIPFRHEKKEQFPKWYFMRAPCFKELCALRSLLENKKMFVSSYIFVMAVALASKVALLPRASQRLTIAQPHISRKSMCVRFDLQLKL